MLAELPATNPHNALLAELAIEARRFEGGYIMHGDRVRGSYGGGSVHLQPDGRYAYQFSHEWDALDFRSEAMRVAESHGVDVEMTIHPYSSGKVIVLVRLDPEGRS